MRINLNSKKNYSKKDICNVAILFFEIKLIANFSSLLQKATNNVSKVRSSLNNVYQWKKNPAL